MKTTMDIDDALYRQLKAHAALNGQSVKTVITEAIMRLLSNPTQPQQTTNGLKEVTPEGVGKLSAVADNANGQHDITSMRLSVAKGRRPK